MRDGSRIVDEIDVADAHPAGARPFEREQYIEKFKTLTQGIISEKESKKFLKIVQNLKNLKSSDLMHLNIKANPSKIRKIRKNTSIF